MPTPARKPPASRSPAARGPGFSRPTRGGNAGPRNIRMLALDVDGVLTDGSILLDDHGVETKRFNVRDGQGITAWLRLGLDVAIITRRAGRALEHRCRELGIPPEQVIQGAKDKSAALDALLDSRGILANQIAYMGDDWPDMPVMRRVGYALAPSDADPRVRKLAAFVTGCRGGHGAVREAIEHILDAQGRMPEVLGWYA